VDAWTFIWLMFILKIPIVGLFLIVRWAVRQGPEVAPEEDGGISHSPRPHHPSHPRHPRPRLPRHPRRGPHGGPHHGASTPAPPRIRTVAARGRLTAR
jgi:hypothetical protein